MIGGKREQKPIFILLFIIFYRSINIMYFFILFFCLIFELFAVLQKMCK